MTEHLTCAECLGLTDTDEACTHQTDLLCRPCALASCGECQWIARCDEADQAAVDAWRER